MNKIPPDGYNDEQTFKTLQDGDTVGLFQLESFQTTRYLKDIHPENMEELTKDSLLLAFLTISRPAYAVQVAIV